MTENEAKATLEEVKILDDSMYQYNMNYINALNVLINALEEIQQYREIGTVGECREAMEKQNGKNPVLNENSNVMFCPVCERKIRRNYDLHCSGCGQLLDYSNIKLFE